MTETIIAEIPIRDGEVHRISRCERDGRIKVQLRRWFRSAEGDWRPGREGISLRREHIAQVVGAVLTAGTRGRG